MPLDESTLTIRKAAPEDIDVAARLFDDYRGFYERPSDLAGATRFLTERITNAESHVFLAFVDGEPVAFAQVYPTFSSIRMRPVWTLNDLFVVPASRNLGIGRRVLGFLNERARAEGVAAIGLATARDNAAAAHLYRSLGYEQDLAFDHYERSLPLD